jgi:hypothetical protein
VAARARPYRRAALSISSSAAARALRAGQAIARAERVLLVDTKYELGRDPDGEIVLIDEIHTPDSSRYWYADSYEPRWQSGEDPRSLDKEYVRRWLVEQGFRGDGPPPDPARRGPPRGRAPLHRGLRAAHRPAFEADPEPPLPRLRRTSASPERPRRVEFSRGLVATPGDGARAMQSMIASCLAFAFGLMFLSALLPGMIVRDLWSAFKAALICGLSALVLGKLLFALLSLIFFFPILITGPLGAFLVQTFVNAVLLAR